MTYHSIDSSPFGLPVKLCFDQAGANKILADHDIDFVIDAFDLGCAETHYISDGRDSMIVVIIDADRCAHDTSFACGIAAHEAYHVVCRIFQHIGQPMYDVGEEVFAYTLEHITKQLYANLEKKLNAGKAGRSVPKQKGKRSRRDVIQMDQLGERRTGSDSAAESAGVDGRTEDGHWDSFFKTETGIQSNQPTGSSSIRAAK